MKNSSVHSRLTWVSEGELVLVTGGEKTKIIGGVQNDFDLCTTPEGSLDIFAADKDGGLVHIVYDNGQVKSRSILKNRTRDSIVCNVRVLKVNEHIHIFYCLRRKDNMLVHQIIHEDILSEPYVVDYVDSHMVFDVIRDGESNVDILYSDADGNLGVCSWKNSTKRYTEKMELSLSCPRHINLIRCADGVYGAVVVSEGTRASIYAADITTGKVKCGVKNVSLKSRTALLPQENGFIIKWAENSMCFETECTYDLEFSGVAAPGRCGNFIRVRSGDGDTFTDVCLFPPSGNIGDAIRVIDVEDKTAEPLPKGYEVENMHRKYKDILSGGAQLESITSDIARIEASLSRLITLTERALGEIKDHIETDHSIEEMEE